MAHSNDFRLGARVVDCDGETAGTLVSVLVEEDGFDPKALVVKGETSLVGRLLAEERFFITDEVVVPMSAVASANHDAVRLSIPRDQVKREKPYINYRFQPETAGEVLMKEAQLLGGGLAFPDVAEGADKPAGQIEIDKDENVMIRNTGHRFGKVHDLLFDDGELVGIVVRTEGLTGHDVVLPIRFVYRGDDMALFADLREVDIKALKRFEENPG